jgi:adenosylcobinamide-phosphate synthase
MAFGEVPDRFHPTLWMGQTAGYMKKKLRHKNAQVEKVYGICLCLFILVLFVVPTFFGLFWIRETFGWPAYVIVGALVLQTTFAIKCMKDYTLPVADAVEKEDYDRAKQLLPFVVRRNPKELTRQQIISAAVETIAEGTTDGITSPFFFFALFGVPGAVAFRAINTLDSMVGYKDKEHINIGWFSAKMDTIVNYVPARLTGLLIIFAALILGRNWRKAWTILKRDKNNMKSPNAGWTIATMAGALDVQLEKQNCYTIGDSADLQPTHILQALRIMIFTSVLFTVLVVLPIIILRTSLAF